MINRSEIIDNPQINPRVLLELYLNQDYDQLSETFLQVWEHFQNKTYYALDLNLQYFINVFVKNFLYLFTQPDYVLSDRHVNRFIKQNLTISNLVAMSGFKNTDAYLQILNDQPRNFAKLLTLYSARNNVKFDKKALFDANYQLACLWYSCFCESYRSGVINQQTRENLQEHITYKDERLSDFHNIDDIYFGASYIDGDLDREIKHRINASIKNSPFATTAQINNHPHPKKIAVITSLWFSQHSVYRILSEFVESLKDDYELTLVHLGDIRNNIDIGFFKEIKYVYVKDNYLNIDALRENDFTAVFYPDIGMTVESIFLCNLRIAPIQICGLGHSVSTFGSEIDYYVSGADVEIPEGAEANYSERLVLLPGFGAIHNKPNYQIRNIEKKRPEMIINCPWYAQKVNYSLVSDLKEIAAQSQKQILFRFFSGGALTRKNDFIPFATDLESILGKDCIELMPAKSYNEYMALMEEGDICIEAYHFGGCNTVVDSLYLRQPTVTFEGDKWYSRIGSQLLRSVGLSELIAHSPAEYISLTLKLIHDDEYRLKIREKLAHADLNTTIFNADSKIYFKTAMDFLIAHHEQLKNDNSKTPLRIPLVGK
jgi:predicted O-linked N-acetylglucosamine transferase (SPINDLY family)